VVAGGGDAIPGKCARAAQPGEHPVYIVDCGISGGDDDDHDA